MWNHIAIIKKMKSIIPLKIKVVIIRILFFCQCLWYGKFQKKIDKNHDQRNRIYFLLSTDYANLGDHAMSYASICFFEKYFPKYEIVEITVNDTLKKIYGLKKIIQAGDIICLKGGGNIGIEYFREELIRRKIINTFENKIIIFPQTVFFPDTKLGDLEFKNTIQIYNNNSNVYIFLRDKPSFNLCKGKLNNIFLVPDIVFSLQKDNLFQDERVAQKYISICMIDDVEGVYNSEFKKILFTRLTNKYGDIKQFDTIKPYYISTNNRISELRKIMNEIRSSKVVITDRLHGMILAYLLDIPCLVLKTYNYKLIAQYEWLKKCNYIKKVDKDDIDEIIKNIDSLLNDQQRIHVCLDTYFEKIREIMENK